MKKIVYSLLFVFVVSFSLTTYAQTIVNLAANDSLIINLEGRKQGDIEWQRSTGGNWLPLTAGRNSETFRYKVTAPTYFRSVVKDGTCNPVVSDTIQANINLSYSVKGGHGYVESEPYVSTSGITMREKGTLSSWTNTASKAVWYLYQKPGTYAVSFNMSGSRNRVYDFEMKTTRSDEPENIEEDKKFEPEIFNFTYTGTGSTETHPVFIITIPETGYYRYELNGKSATMSGLTINELQFDTAREPGQVVPDTHATTYLSSPSVHLNFSTTASTTKEYDWMYQEILVPEGLDPVATYWESLGFFAGYMGIQANSATERRVLFSVWDALDKDHNPNLPTEVLVTLVDKGENVQANAFGNEGTGGQSYVGTNNPNTWKTGTPVKFLMNARRDGQITYEGETLYNSNGTVAIKAGDIIKHTIISAWYDANDGQGWKYIASWRGKRFAGARDMFDGFYSFLENFGYSNGQMNRRGYYYNAFGRELTTGKWQNFNRVTFSNTDGSTGQRVDYGQGIDDIHPDKFFMHSGGYGQTEKTGTSATLPLLNPDTVQAIQDLDLAVFTARVDAAIERENYLNNLQYFDKTGWSVVSFSSEQVGSEPNGNGRANLIIDGNDDTYWHSQWTGSGSSFPHWFVVDMAQAKTVKGFRIVPSGGTSRYPKDIKIEVSNSPDSGWAEVWSGQAPLSPELIELSSPAEGYRYFKLSILNGYSDGAHTRIGEIYVF
ncbi:MAG: DUF3472 domain-containing protein [Bacteroidales bacterium]|nr:DUF3472 domain-containing protein [Bacteroidales bacterium]